MKKIPRILVLAATATLALGGLCGAALASDLSASADVVHSRVAGHPYQNGGASREQVREMEQHLKPYDLRMTYSAGRHNAYVTDVRLRIVDAQGHRVFGLAHAGPLTDVALPAGHYRVQASFGGVRRSAAVDVKPGQPADLYLHWPRDVG
jgi:hypothetical protein